jgi:hypothetical protein
MHILVDLDGTLAVFHSLYDIGEPIEEMCWRVREWLRDGKDVRIFTARVAGPDAETQRLMIEEWTRDMFGRTLPVTNAKDGQTEAIYDNIAFRVEKDTGRVE